jgi:type IV pilus assembly protein PilA
MFALLFIPPSSPFPFHIHPILIFNLSNLTMRILWQLGFSLIELMIVVAIISILAVVATPSYQTYTERARFLEIITATEPFKIAVSLALQEGYPLAELSNSTHGIPANITPTKYLSALTVKKGVIMASASKLLHENTYILTPDKNGVIWNVSGTCLADNLCSQ